jgi:four helix bundle protein
MARDTGYDDLLVFKKAFNASMEIYAVSKLFPNEEKYSLTDQIRRSSRSVSINIAEGYRKRVYPKSFLAKLIDADGECSETIVWLDYARKCSIINELKFKELRNKYEEIGKLLGYMIKNPHKYL